MCNPLCVWVLCCAVNVIIHKKMHLWHAQKHKERERVSWRKKNRVLLCCVRILQKNAQINRYDATQKRFVLNAHQQQAFNETMGNQRSFQGMNKIKRAPTKKLRNIFKMNASVFDQPLTTHKTLQINRLNREKKLKMAICWAKKALKQKEKRLIWKENDTNEPKLKDKKLKREPKKALKRINIKQARSKRGTLAKNHMSIVFARVFVYVWYTGSIEALRILLALKKFLFVVLYIMRLLSFRFGLSFVRQFFFFALFREFCERYT